MQLFKERADENAMKIWDECFREAYGKEEEQGKKCNEEEGVGIA